MYLVLFLFILIIILGILENYVHQKHILNIPLRILVNGTRGKTSVTKMLVEVLNENGIKTMGKTSGSQPNYIYPDGKVEIQKRKHKARIIETIPFFTKASSIKVECVVVEDMALISENQKIYSQKLVKPTHLIITNSFVDHIAEIGSTTRETVWTLSQSIINNCQLFVCEDYYNSFKCKLHQVNKEFSKEEIEEIKLKLKPSLIDLHINNVLLVLSLCKTLNIEEKSVLEAISKTSGDIGLLKCYELKNKAEAYFNFSINDLHSMQENLNREELKKYEKIIIIFNNRKEREYRIITMKKLILNNKSKIEKVYCIGDYPRKVQRYLLNKTKIPCEAITIQDLNKIMNEKSNEVAFVCLGNIIGAGIALIESFGLGNRGN